jgi:hypothetical protein
MGGIWPPKKENAAVAIATTALQKSMTTDA